MSENNLAVRRSGGRKKKSKGYQKRRGIKATCIIIAIICCAAVIAIVCAGITPERYNLSLGENSANDIVATKDIEDKLTTEQKRQEARDAVQKVYVINKEKTDACLKDIEEAFESVVSVHEQGAEDKEQQTGLSGIYIPSASYIDDLIRILAIDNVDRATVLDIIDAHPDRIQEVKNLALSAVKNILSAGLKEEDIKNQRDYIIGNIFADGNDEVMASVSYSILDKHMKANSFPDDSATELAIRDAEEAVEPVTYKKGHYIVRMGDTVTQAQMNMLRELGLLSNQGIDISLYVGVAALIIVLLFIVGMYIYIYEREMLKGTKSALLLSLITVIVLLANYLLIGVEPNLIQVYYATMLIGMLLKTRMAIVVNASLSVITGMMLSDTTGMFPMRSIVVMLVSLVSGTVAAYMCRKPMHRMRIMGTGLTVGLVGAVTAACVGMIIYDSAVSALESAIWPLINGMISAVLCVGTLPVWEMLFDIQTPTKLLELTNPNHALLRRLALEAPGTYHHSIVVANLAETAADAIGANAMLVRAGAYYHDVGKLSAPEGFTENQTDKSKSIHNMMTPTESAALIRSHTVEGEELAVRYKLPKAIRDIIKQHHGTSTVGYFYAQALEQSDDVDAYDFKYAGPKPASKEAALIMLADSVEAAVRSMQDKSYESVREKIHQLIKERVNAGELDECDISMLELSKVANEFAQALGAVHHERVEYPDLQKAIEHNKNRRYSGSTTNDNRYN